MERIRPRSVEKFGSRVFPGVDIDEQEGKLFDFAASCNEDKTKSCLGTLGCPVIRIDSSKNVAKIVTEFSVNIKK